ncbi:MAG: Ig-like domain-containing protein [Methanofastidiosum sp.]
MLSIKKIITSFIIFSLIMPCFLVSSVWASGGAVDDSAICNKGSTVLIDVLANDTGLTRIGPISSPKHGTTIIEKGKIRYTPDPNWYGIDTFTYSATTDTALFCPDTGHYYEFVSDVLTWGDANTAASDKAFYGLEGYLVTITSEAENICVTSLLSEEEDSAWIGATDGQSEDHNWSWVAGPEVGQIFSQGLSPNVIEVGYANWNVNEPNNSDETGYYGQLLSAGYWNDLSSDGELTGYIVEYGGMPNDVSTLPTATVKIIVLNNPTLSIHAELKASYNNRLKTVNSLESQILNKLPEDCKQSGVSSAGCSVPDNVKSMWTQAEQYIQNTKKTGNVIKAVNDLKKAKELLEQILTKI